MRAFSWSTKLCHATVSSWLSPDYAPPMPAVCTLSVFLDPELHGHPTAHQLLLRPRGADLPVLGTVSAGFPSPADEELSDTLSLDAYLIRNKEATYRLKVNGHSMMDAGILPG